MTEEQQLLILKWMPLVHKFSRKFSPYFEDTFQTGMLHLCRKVKFFDPEKGQFITLAKFGLMSKMYQCYRRCRGEYRKGSSLIPGRECPRVISESYLSPMYDNIDLDEKFLEAEGCDNHEDAVDDVDLIEYILHTIYYRSNKRTKQIVQARFLGKTLREIAEQFEITKSRVQQIIAAVIDKVRAIPDIMALLNLQDTLNKCPENVSIR